jgi:hypothetical protein
MENMSNLTTGGQIAREIYSGNRVFICNTFSKMCHGKLHRSFAKNTSAILCKIL